MKYRILQCRPGLYRIQRRLLGFWGSDFSAGWEDFSTLAEAEKQVYDLLREADLKRVMPIIALDWNECESRYLKQLLAAKWAEEARSDARNSP